MQTIKQKIKSLNMREIAERNGLKINRSGFCKCPFHDEKTASFRIYAHSFYCFGCDTGGDAINFIMKLHNLDFKSALKYAGIEPGEFQIKPNLEQLRKQAFNDKIEYFKYLINSLMFELKYNDPALYFYHESVLTYWLDLLIFGSEQDKYLIYSELKGKGL